MDIMDALNELRRFAEVIRPFFPELRLTTTRPLDAKVFPDELQDAKTPLSGVYILFRTDGEELLYVGISNDLPGRIYDHIGTGFTWARGGAQCSFPNMKLAAERPWLSEATQALLRRGDFSIQVVGVTPPECSALLEAFLVARSFVKEGRKPEINVEF